MSIVGVVGGLAEGGREVYSCAAGYNTGMYKQRNKHRAAGRRVVDSGLGRAGQWERGDGGRTQFAGSGSQMAAGPASASGRCCAGGS